MFSINYIKTKDVCLLECGVMFSDVSRVLLVVGHVTGVR
jgi:hypothetical protein